jgi:hypothetical protein
MDQFGGVCPSLHNNGSGQGIKQGREEDEESFVDKFCLKHP